MGVRFLFYWIGVYLNTAKSRKAFLRKRVFLESKFHSTGDFVRGLHAYSEHKMNYINTYAKSLGLRFMVIEIVSLSRTTFRLNELLYCMNSLQQMAMFIGNV